MLVGGVGLFLGDASDGLREVSLGLAQGLRASDLGAGLLDGLMGLFERRLNGCVERLLGLVRHALRLRVQSGQTLAVRGGQSFAGSQEASGEPGLMERCGQRNGQQHTPGGTVKLSEKDESILGLGLDQASLAIPVTSAQT